MKKVLYLALIIGIAISFTFCSNNQKPATEEKQESEQSQMKEESTQDTIQEEIQIEETTDTVAVEEPKEITKAEPEPAPKKEAPKKIEAPAKDKRTKVIIHTSFGDITAELFNETPKHRDNFIKNIKEGGYKDSPWHRVMNHFMIQGGQNADGTVDKGYTVPAEFRPEFFHKKGALAAARQPDQVNPKMASSSCQFYIVQGQVLNTDQLNMFAQRYNLNLTPEQIKAYTTIGGSPHLDGTYTVFGQVIDGLDVVDKIAAVKTGKGDQPVEKITMDIEIVEE